MNSNKKMPLIWLAILISIFISGCATQPHSRPGTTVTVVMIRHADRTAITKVLTKRGHANARALVGEIGNMKITTIYSPSYVRNLDTVRPLAKHLGIGITIKPKKGSVPHYDSFIKQIITKHSGETILWVGNTNNLPPLYWGLGGKGNPPDNYGDLFILTIPDKGATRIEKRTWGKF